MKIYKLNGSSKQSGLIRLAFNGEMTIFTADAAQRQLSLYLDGYSKFELDLSDITEIDTAGIQLLLMLHQKSTHSNKPVRILAVSEPVFNRLKVYGLLDCFDLTQNLEEAKVAAN